MEIRTEKMLTAEQRRAILDRIMGHYNLGSQAEFARRLGISPQNVNSWWQRGTYNVELIAVCFPELSGDWLLTGEDPMLKADRVSTPAHAPATELSRALAALAEEQKLTAKAQAQADRLLAILHTIAQRMGRPE